MQAQHIHRLVEDSRKYFGLPPRAGIRCACALAGRGVRGPHSHRQTAGSQACGRSALPRSPRAA
jgi:hypothetical protein